MPVVGDHPVAMENLPINRLSFDACGASGKEKAGADPNRFHANALEAKLEAYSSRLRMQPKRVRAARGFSGALPSLPPRHEGQLLEKVHVLLVLQKRAVQRRDELARVALA